MRIALAQMKISSDVEVNYRKSISLIRVASLNGANKRWNLNCDEQEQRNLKNMTEVLRQDLKQQDKQQTDVKAFISVVKKYTDMKELDATILREFIDHIEVSHADRKSKTREITIVYNFIGAFDFSRAIEEAHHSNQKQQETA